MSKKLVTSGEVFFVFVWKKTLIFYSFSKSKQTRQKWKVLNL